MTEIDNEQTIDDLLDNVDEVVGEQVPEQSGFKFNFSFLTTETGEGAIEDYLDHPLNFNGSKSMAQILRGLTGLFGSLKLAVIDIAIGGMNFVKERKTSAN